MGHVHYVIIRRDLPIGVLAAMVTHAAGESGAKYGTTLPEHTIAVVLEVKTESDLNKAEELLFSNKVDHVNIYETGGPYDGQFMAIGLTPAERTDQLTKLMSGFQLLKGVDNPNPGV